MSGQASIAESLRWVVCPVCRQPLGLETETLRCKGCGRRYLVIDDIPVLLADRAT